MRTQLMKDLQQTRPHATLPEEVSIQIFRTAEVARKWVTEEIKRFGLSHSTINILRILRGSHPDPLPSCRIGERMVNHDPDLTRLLDRLERAGLISKSRDARDRRVVNISITERGLDVVGKASVAAVERLTREMSHMQPAELERLADLLELLRAKPEQDAEVIETPSRTTASRPRAAAQRGRSPGRRAAR